MVDKVAGGKIGEEWAATESGTGLDRHSERQHEPSRRTEQRLRQEMTRRSPPGTSRYRRWPGKAFRPQPRCPTSWQHFRRALLLDCIKPGVEQVFQPAGEGGFLVALLGVRRGGRNWKVPSTRRLESLRYVAELDAALRLVSASTNCRAFLASAVTLAKSPWSRHSTRSGPRLNPPCCKR